MRLIKKIYKTETLLSMLDEAITCLIENEACQYCSLFSKKPCAFCFDEDKCRAYIFEGLLKKIRRGNKKNVSY